MAWSEAVVGRTGELAELADAVRALGEGGASALVIEGEAGIGKSRLVQAIEQDARAGGVNILHGRGHPFERTRPFGLVATALGSRMRLDDADRAAVGALPIRDPAGPEPVGVDVRYQVLDEVVEIVEACCAQRPTVLVAEDIHWADPGSLAAISAVVRRMPYSAVLVVVTVRTSPRSAEVSQLLEDLEGTGARTLRLAPLPRGDILTLATLQLGGPPGPGLAAMLDKTSGNPLWATAMLRSLADAGKLVRSTDGVEATTAELPASLSDLVVRRMRDVPPATIELLQIAAVLGDAVAVRDLAAVVRRPPVDVAGLLDPAFDARLLDVTQDRVAFRHQLVHDAIYQHVPAPTRRVLHREVAITLMATGADRLEVADHLVLGAERGDDEAVMWLRDAAREASPAAPGVAVELLRRAEALLRGGHPDTDLISTEVVEALLRAGQVEAASSRAEAVLTRSHSAAVDTRLRLALLGALALQNRADEVVAIARAFLDRGTPLWPAEEVSVLAQQSWALTYSGDPAAGESAARRAVDLADGAGGGALSVWARTALLVAVGRQGRFGEALGHARGAATLAADSSTAGLLPLSPKLFLGLTLFDCDLVSEARTAYRDALDDSFDSGWWLAETLMADAEACFEIGDWEDTLPRLAAGADAAREKHHPLLLSQSLAYQIVIATAMGDLAAAQLLAAGLAASVERDQPSYNAGLIAFALAELRVAQGDTQGAYEVLLRCWRYDVTHGGAYYHRRLGPDLVRLALASDQPAVAAEVAESLADAAARAPEVPTVRSVALRCAGLVTGDVDAVLEAVTLARRSMLLLPHTGACEDAATLLAGSGRTEQATALLGEALERFERAGADAWAARVRARMRGLGAHPGSRGPRKRPATGWGSLTATERTISALVAEGMTNGAVARQLYISPHTVNTHLRHIFAKLGVSNRVALAGVVHHSIK